MPEAKKLDPLMPEGEGKPELNLNHVMGCHLQVIGGVGGCFAYDNGKSFDALLKRNHGVASKEGYSYKGAHFTGNLCSIRSTDAKTIAELEKRGFKLLGIQKGAHGAYKMALYGEGFE